MSETGATDERPSFPGYLFGFTGRIGPRHYFLGTGAAVAALIDTLMLAALAMARNEGAQAAECLEGWPEASLRPSFKTLRARALRSSQALRTRAPAAAA